MMKTVATEWLPLQIAVLTVSDSRTLAEDRAGDWLQSALLAAGHQLAQRALLPDNRYRIRARVAQWIADECTQVVLVNGGTGLRQGADHSIAALRPLFDKEVAGFGEQFRALSFAEIGSSAMQSGALAGVANGTVVFAMPGSPGACELAWQQLIAPQLDIRTRPCSFAAALKGNSGRCASVSV
jgi:molybdopterin adenylyltransferase